MLQYRFLIYLCTYFQLNIPLNLPQLPKTSVPCGGYEDDPIPLRVHDCLLDLQVVCDPKGIVCICHHYLYQVNWTSSQSSPYIIFDKEKFMLYIQQNFYTRQKNCMLVLFSRLVNWFIKNAFINEIWHSWKQLWR